MEKKKAIPPKKAVPPAKGKAAPPVKGKPAPPVKGKDGASAKQTEARDRFKEMIAKKKEAAAKKK